MLVGNSRRLPKKHLIEVLPGMRLIDLVVENLRKIGLEVVIYSKYPFPVDAEMIIDREAWILPSIVSLFSRDSEFFLFGGDMPLIKKEAVEILLNNYEEGKSVVPRWRATGYLEPLHAIYSSSSLPCLKGAPSLTLGLKKCAAVKFIPADEMLTETFFNVNTAEDLENLRRILLS